MPPILISLTISYNCAKKPRQRAVHHSDESVLNGSFSPILHKKFPKCVSIPGILLFVLKKSYHFKTEKHLEKVEIRFNQGKKTRNPLWIVSLFNADWGG